MCVLQDYSARNQGVMQFPGPGMNPELMNMNQPNHPYRQMAYNQAPIVYTQNQPLPPGQAGQSPSHPLFF